MKTYINELNLMALEQVNGGDKIASTAYKYAKKKREIEARELREDFDRRRKEMESIASSRVQAGEEAMKEAMRLNLNTLDQVSGGRNFHPTDSRDVIRRKLRKERELREDFDRRRKEMEDIASSRVQAGEEAMKEAMRINRERLDIA